VSCPHCGTTEDLYYSSAQLRRPLHKRMLFAYVRCHCCTHRFRHLRVGSLVFVGLTVAVFAFAGMIN
jgi:C4-type Zn-finger protein